MRQILITALVIGILTFGPPTMQTVHYTRPKILYVYDDPFSTRTGFRSTRKRHRRRAITEGCGANG
jgi:hypothetical protein